MLGHAKVALNKYHVPAFNVDCSFQKDARFEEALRKVPPWIVVESKLPGSLVKGSGRVGA